MVRIVTIGENKPKSKVIIAVRFFRDIHGILYSYREPTVPMTIRIALTLNLAAALSLVDGITAVYEPLNEMAISDSHAFASEKGQQLGGICD